MTAWRDFFVPVGVFAAVAGYLLALHLVVGLVVR